MRRAVWEYRRGKEGSEMMERLQAVKREIDGPWEYEVQADYGYGDGWECVTTEETRDGARERLREYEANEPGVPFRVRRVKGE